MSPEGRHERGLNLRPRFFTPHTEHGSHLCRAFGADRGFQTQADNCHAVIAQGQGMCQSPGRHDIGFARWTPKCGEAPHAPE